MLRTKYILTICLLLCTLVVVGQSLVANAPSRVQNGENFRLTFVVNTQDADNFQIGELPDAFEIITGPYTSRQSSFQMVNGHTSSSSSITFTFILCATKNGTFTIPAAHVNVEGKKVSSSPLKITVVGNGNDADDSPKMHRDDDDQPQMRKAGSPISGKDLFIKVSANKQRVHEQEPVLLTYKVYTLVDLTYLDGKMPDLTGFHTQEVPMPQQKSFHVENVNGRNYKCVTWSQYVMYPQMTGKLEIPSITFNGTVVQKNMNVDPFEEFFNGGSGYVEVKHSITAPGLTIQVDPLPERPANFSGGVGKFNISAQIDKQEIKANEPFTIRVVVGGTGNMKLMKQPVVNFPKDFDKYEPKVTDKTQLTSNGVEGNMLYDFLAVPRNKGTYTIPPVELVYYDTDANAYKTLKTKSFTINVEKGDGSSDSSASFTDEKNQDIRQIKTGKAGLHDIGDTFFGSLGYWIVLALLLTGFILLLVVFRHRAIENADLVKMRGKRANKVATKRLKQAKKLMEENRQNEFYDEVLRALWGYAGDKMNIPVKDLTHENIYDKLHACGVEEETANDFVKAIDECEYERYAPGDAAGNMSKTYDTAMSAIMKIEDVMNTRKKTAGRHSAARSLLFLLPLLATLLWPHDAVAATKQSADAAYGKGNYQQAIAGYEELLKKGVSADVYYNLGNAYYRTDDIVHAILSYERALLLNPSDDDIRFNLQMARSKTIDKITPESELFFFTWYRSLVNFMNVDGWARTAIFSLLFALVCALLYLFSDRLAWRKFGFYTCLAMLLLFLLSNLFASNQKRMLENRSGAIVIAPSVTIKKTPTASSADQGVIHEGTRVDITDDTMTDWKGIRLSNGTEGWVQTRQIERI